MPVKAVAPSSSSVTQAQGRRRLERAARAVFAKRANAERMVHVAQAKGFSASLSKPDAKGRYRVRVAGLDDALGSALTLVGTAARCGTTGAPRWDPR